MAPPQGSGGAGGIQVVHTDDAATKLSDRVRRRCFNCCTTDTSTWRRSNLSPGKVLCNKCGLFERTHSRPRPEQFPHKRGPLASSTLRSRSPPQAQVCFSPCASSFICILCLSFPPCPILPLLLPAFLSFAFFFCNFPGKGVDFLFGTSLALVTFLLLPRLPLLPPALTYLLSSFLRLLYPLYLLCPYYLD
ncbi:hypothetical protein B0H13DRAFT_1638823 [Mycena leptocephala]|nr:hypothetical protein B0H13DRAFT_1638823 [Mycena leptocephala]